MAKRFAQGLGQIGQGVSNLGETLPTVEFDKGKLRLLPNHNINNSNNLKEAVGADVQGQRDERNTGPLRANEVNFSFMIRGQFYKKTTCTPEFT